MNYWRLNSSAKLIARQVYNALAIWSDPNIMRCHATLLATAHWHPTACNQEPQLTLAHQRPFVKQPTYTFRWSEASYTVSRFRQPTNCLNDSRTSLQIRVQRHVHTHTHTHIHARAHGRTLSRERQLSNTWQASNIDSPLRRAILNPPSGRCRKQRCSDL